MDLSEDKSSILTLENFPFICRICCQRRDDLRPFQEENYLFDLFHSIRKIDGHSVFDLPRNICNDCISKLKDISLFIDISKHTNSYFVENIFPIKIEDDALPEADRIIEEYDNERSRYCRSCLSSSDLSPLEEDPSMLQLFQEITRIDVSANTNFCNGNSICYKCTNALQKASLFLCLSMSNDIAIERLATTVIKKEELTFEGDERLESIEGRNHLKVECKDEHATTDINLFDDGLDSFKEKNEEVIDSELMISRSLSEFKKYSKDVIKIPKQLEEKPFKCDYCDKGFDYKSYLQCHLLTHTEGNPLVCNYCGKEFDHRNNLRTHLLTHTGEKPFKCIYCGKTFSLKHNMQSHVLIHTGDKPFKCDYCHKGFNQKTNLLSHLTTHTGNKPFKCDQCGKGFAQNSNLRTHLRSHTKEKPFKCDHCDKEFTRKTTLESHLLIHTGEKPFKCDYCGKGFAQNSNLRAHLRSHTKEKPFKCDHCGKGFTQNNSLRSHLLTHTGEKPLKCDYCDKGFAIKGALKYHLLTHTREKSLECDYCGKRFSRKNNLQTHLRTHTGEKSFKCDKCGKSFTHKGTLSKHLLTHTS